MTHETTAPVQSLTDEMLDELEASTMAYMRDVADGSASPPRPYNDYAAISGESVLELIATVRQQQALIAQQGAPVAVLERANGIIEWMACRADICPKDIRRLEESSAELRALLAAAPTPPAQQPVAWFTDDHLTDRSATTYDRSVAERWRQKGWPVTALYADLPAVAAERDKLAERCRELEKSVRGHGSEIDRLLVCSIEDAYTINTLRAEVERLTALQLPPGHIPVPRRMLELLIGDPQDPYRANAESVASEMLSGALPDPASHEREFNAVRNVRLLLSEIDRLRAELNTRPGPGMRLCTACKAYHPAENFDPGMACCRAANERNPVYFVRLPDGSMEMHHKEERDVQS